jgi:hypothetical protein
MAERKEKRPITVVWGIGGGCASMTVYFLTKLYFPD